MATTVEPTTEGYLVIVFTARGWRKVLVSDDGVELVEDVDLQTT